MLCRLLFLCFKQKTAYEMRISDWSSGVCSSDLRLQSLVIFGEHRVRAGMIVEADQFAAVPAVERIGGVFGDDHRAIVGMILVDRTQVARHFRRGRRADRDRPPLPRPRHASVPIAPYQPASLGGPPPNFVEAVAPP